MKVSKADFNSILLYMEEETVTISHCTMESHENTIQPRNVTSSTTVTPTPMINKLRNVASTAMVTVRCMITAKSRNVTHTSMVMPTPMINFISVSPDVKITDDPEIKAVYTPDIKVINDPLVDQTPPEPPTYDFTPVEQQGTLHNFFHHVNQGTSSIPCEGKIYHPLPSMDLVAWPREKSACLPRTLAQLTHQDFKKQPPDNFAIMLSLQYLIIPHFL